ncbi:hypothetical protein DFH28DRAFT_1122904 [Melampsora americana]|nr:hypothetical protein DFH28DRAFT_1122904 [Melampsora americana]
MEIKPLDPNTLVISTPWDNQLVYDNATDALAAFKLPTPTATKAPKTRQLLAPKQIVLPTLSAMEPSPSGSSIIAARGRKWTHLSTPRLSQVAKLFPGGLVSTPKPLDVLIKCLIKVAKATLVPKSKKPSSIKVDVKSAANILLLTSLIQERAGSIAVEQPIFEPGCKTVTNPTSSLSLAFEFRVPTIAEQVDVLSEHISKLMANGQTNPAGTKAAHPPKYPSYALAASKHALNTPSSSHTGAQARPCPQSKVGPHLQSDHTVTLKQMDPRT